MELHQTNKFLYSKGNNQEVKKLPMEQEKTFAVYTTNRGLIFRIYEKLQKLNNNQANNSEDREEGNEQAFFKNTNSNGQQIGKNTQATQLVGKYKYIVVPFNSSEILSLLTFGDVITLTSMDVEKKVPCSTDDGSGGWWSHYGSQ